MLELVNNDIKTILQNDENLKGLDFTELRREALLRLGKLSGKVWTDHNTHDPGVTILEVLIYALIDLGYRTRLPIEDLLALPSDVPIGEDDNFPTPMQALTCNPTTILDYRKLLMEIKGVRNAWLEVAEAQELQLFVNPQQPDQLTCVGTSNDCEIILNGLYKIILEKEPEADSSVLFDQAVHLLSAHRNLCEDFMDITMLCNEQLGVCAEVSLKPGADAEAVYEELLKRLRDFISPTVHRYTLPELLDKGRSIEEVFAGRPYSTQSLGFIDTEELENLSLRKQFRLSDIYRVMMDVPEVHTVKGLKIKSIAENGSERETCEWSIQLAKDHAPFFSTDLTCLNLTSSGSLVSINKEKVHRLLSKAIPHTLALKELDLPVPLGRHLNDLGDYWSIQHDFPLTYGIGEGGLAANGSKLRMAQAMQLKGYLLFFDQLLANYLTQLSQLRKLFSRQQESKRPVGDKHHSFSQPLGSVPTIEKLVRFFSDKYEHLSPNIAFAVPMEDSIALAEKLVELKEELTGHLLLDTLCDDGQGFPQLCYPTAYRRDASLSKIIRDFQQGDVNVEIWQDEGGHFFLLRMTEGKGLMLIGAKRYATDADAREAANLAIFLGGMAPNYLLASKDNMATGDFDYCFTLSFNPIDYVGYLQQLTESETDYLRNRERLLDHLLARFAEQFADYSLLVYGNDLDGITQQKHRIEAKSQLLSTVDELSRIRGKASDYLQPAWGTDNISGLERRAAMLAGIPASNKRTLCHFEVVKCEDQFSIVLTDFEGRAIFTDETNYGTASAAEVAASQWLDKFRIPGFYASYERSHGSRQATMLRRLFLPEPGEEEITVSDWNWRLEMRNAADLVVRTSKRTDYHSEAQAVKDIAKLAANVQKLTTGDEPASFDLLPMPDGAWLDFNGVNKEIRTVLGFRWVQYSTKAEVVDQSGTAFRTAAEAMTDFLKNSPVEDYILFHKTGWQWQIVVEDDKALTSARIFADAGSAKQDWQDVKEAANDAKNFVTVELEGGQYRLDLTTPMGAVVARSSAVAGADIRPNDYAKLLSVRFSDRRSFINYLQVNGAYSYFLRNAEGITFLQGYFLHRTPNEAVFALIEAFAEGKSPNCYVKTGGGFGQPYYFWLTDQMGEPLGSPPNTFNGPKEQEAAVTQCLQYFGKRKPPVVVTERAEQAYWLLRDERGMVLLKSTTEQANEQESIATLKRLLPLMATAGSYAVQFTGNGYLLQLVEGDKPVAEHEELRLLSAECDGLIQRIGYALRQESYAISPAKSAAKYRFEYWWYDKHEVAAPMFQGHQKYLDKAAAVEGYKAFFKDFPSKVIEKMQDNPYQFACYGSNKELVATQHPANHGKDEYERVKAFQTWFGRLQGNNERLVKEMLRSDVGQWLFRALKKDEPFAINPSKYRSKEEAIKQQELICTPGAKVDYLRLCSSGNVLTMEIVHHLQQQGRTVSKRKQYHFLLRRRDDNQLLFVSYKGYDTEADATAAFQENYLEILRLASDMANYDTSGNAASATKPLLVLDLGADFIETTDGCPNGGILAIVPEQVANGMGLEALSKLALTYPVACTTRRHHYVLRNAMGQTIFISAKGYTSRQQALDAYGKEAKDMLTIAADPASYDQEKSRIGAIDPRALLPAAVPYTQNPVLLVPKGIWRSLSSVGLQAAAAAFLAEGLDAPVICTFDHACGDDCHCDDPCQASERLYSFQCFDIESRQVVWRSAALYDSPELAMQHFYLLLDLLNQKENCRVLCNKGEWQVVILEVLAESEGKFESEVAAWGSAISSSDACKHPTCTQTGLNALIEAASEDWGYFPYFDEDSDTYAFKIVGKDFCLAKLACQYESAEERNVGRKKLWQQTQELLVRKAGYPRRLDENKRLQIGPNYFWNIPQSDGRAVQDEGEIICRIMYAATSPASYQQQAGRLNLVEFGSGKLLAFSEIREEAELASFKKEALRAANAYPLYCRDGCYHFRLQNPLNAPNSDLSPETYQMKSARQARPPVKGRFGVCEAPYLWESVQCYPCADAAWAAFERFCELAKQEENFKPTQANDCGPYTWQIADPAAIIGKSVNSYSRRYDSLQAMERLQACVNDEGLHLLEHILLRPKSMGECFSFSTPGSNEPQSCLLDVCADKGCELCWFLDPDEVCSQPAETEATDPSGNNPTPPLLHCGGTDGEDAPLPSIPYVPGSDPYSFWATVFMPGWTKRFRKPENRIAMENMLYREAPVGVALHILWLNPANFCRLETKYRQWLAWRETEGSGLLCESLVAPVCDLADCLNTLCNEDFLCTGAAAQTGGCGCLQVDDEAAPSGSRLLFTCHCEPAPTTPPTPTDEPAGQPPKDEVTPVEPPKDEPTPVNEPADGPLVPIIDVAQPEKELPVLDVPNDTAPTAAVTEPPKDIASQSTPASVKPIKPSAADPLVQKAKPTARPVLSGGAATPPAPATTPIEGNGSRIRKRKPGYLKAITDMADGQLTSTASFELTKAFLENEPLASQYEKLVAYVIKQVIKQPAGSSDEQYWTLLRNATWHFLDKAVMDDGEHIPEPTAILLRNTFQTFRENGLDMGTLRNGWEGQVLKQILGSAVVDEYKQMMG